MQLSGIFIGHLLEKSYTQMLVLHIGYAKAATTLLQKRVFPNIPDINYIGRFYGNDLPQSKKADWVYNFVFDDDISLKSYADKISEGINDCDARNLVSHECLLRPYNTYRCIQRMRNLKTYFEEIKLIVSIRNQADIILSRSVHDRGVIQYKSIVNALDFEGLTQCKWPRCASYDRLSFLTRKTKCECRIAGVKYINIPFYNYLNIYCLLRSIFGRKNIHFIVSEELQENYFNEINRLTRFLGLSPVDEQVLLNLTVKRENKRQGSTFYENCQKEYLASGKRHEVFEYFKEANTMLSNILQLNLEKHGYY